MDKEFKKMMDQVMIKPEIPFLTETEIEEQLQPFTVNIKDADDKQHPITMPLGMWDMYLAITHGIETTTQQLILDAQEFLKECSSDKTLSDVIIQYISELYRRSYPTEEDKVFGWDANHDRIMHYISSDGHNMYDQLKELQWRIDNKPKYIIPPHIFPTQAELI